MKKLLLLASLLAATMPALGQGYVNFANGAAGVSAPATNFWEGGAGPNYPRLAGSAYRAMLYTGPAGTIYPGALTTNGVEGTSVPFSTGAQAGFFFGGRRTITGYGAGEIITAQVRVWSAAYPNWESAAPYRVKSNLIQVQLNNTATGASLIGLQSMIYVGPLWAPPSCGVLSNAFVQAGSNATLVPDGFSPAFGSSFPYCCDCGPLNFKWSRNGTTLSFAQTLTITNAQPADAGTYVVRVETDQGWRDISGTLTVLAPLVALNSPAYTNGGFQFTLTGQAGSNYVIQSSTDLSASNWVSRVTNTAPFTFVETNPGPQQFYRAITP